jgi:hypothetical protein
MTAEKSIDHSSDNDGLGADNETHYLVARGALSPGDRRLASLFLARLGLESEFMSPDQYQTYLEHQGLVSAPIVPKEPDLSEKKPGLYAISDITNPNQFMVKEHFDDFAKTYDSQIRLQSITIFGRILVAPDAPSRNTKSVYGRVPHRYHTLSPPNGVIVRARAETGFTEYTGKLDRYGREDMQKLVTTYAVQAGSLVSFGKQFEGKLKPKAYEVALAQIAHLLETQFVD